MHLNETFCLIRCLQSIKLVIMLTSSCTCQLVTAFICTYWENINISLVCWKGLEKGRTVWKGVLLFILRPNDLLTTFRFNLDYYDNVIKLRDI